MMYRLFVCLLLLLGACATPRQQCVSEATKTLRTLDALIVETRENIDRGYALRQEVRPTARLQFCTHPGNFHLCTQHTHQLVGRPEAIDLEEEARKLASLERRRATVNRQAALDVQACQAQFPEV